MGEYYTAEQRDEYILVRMPGNGYHLTRDEARKLHDSLDRLFLLSDDDDDQEDDKNVDGTRGAR